MQCLRCIKENKVRKSQGKFEIVNNWEYIDENDDSRKAIYQWSKKRHKEFDGCKQSYHHFLLYMFSIDILVSFVKNFNYMVLLQMFLAGCTVYLFQSYNIAFEMNVMLFVSPVVFPLAFSINTDFQRRERVLGDLAIFKSSLMSFFFSMRDWKEPAGLDDNWFKFVHSKVKSLLFHLREYLLTNENSRRQQLILQAMYEDFSDINQLVEKFRTSQIAITNGLVSGPIYSLKELILSFERLRNVREYRSPRSIRSFTKVFILLIPIIFAPYFVFLGNKITNGLSWPPYFLAVLTSFVFGALQGVQDKLDDPFNGMNEDDLKISSIDDWTFQSLDMTLDRTYNIGRFQVTKNVTDNQYLNNYRQQSTTDSNEASISSPHKTTFRKNNMHEKSLQNHVSASRHIFRDKFADKLEKTPGDVLIKRCFVSSSPESKHVSYSVPLDSSIQDFDTMSTEDVILENDINMLKSTKLCSEQHMDYKKKVKFSESCFSLPDRTMDNVSTDAVTHHTYPSCFL